MGIMRDSEREHLHMYRLGFEHGWTGGPKVLDDAEYVRGWGRGREHRKREYQQTNEKGKQK